MIHSLIEKVDSLLDRKYTFIAVLLLLFVITFVPRLYRIDNPIADWHSWRQADTSAITRNFIKEGFTPLYPKFDALNSLNEGNLPNPERYFFAEFPLYNILVYPFYVYFGVDVMYGRLVSVIASSFAAVFLYLLVRKYSTNTTALLASFFFAVIPYNIYYGRVTMADPLHIFLSILSLYLVTLWAERKSMLWAGLAGLVTAGTILTKPYGLVLGLPMLYILWRSYGFKLLKSPTIYLFGLLALAPFFWWRWHINQYPEGMFGTTWLFNQGDIRFTGSYFRWLIYDRMNRLIFATGGFVLFFLGLATKKKKGEAMYYWWLLGILIFFGVIAKGNVTHDYYQMPLVPIGCIFMAQGFIWLVSVGKGFVQSSINLFLATILVLIMVAFGWFEVRGYFNVNRPEIVELGMKVDELTPPDAKVIAPYQNDPAFLYQTNRYGWTNGGGLIRYYIEEEGATHLASVNFDDDTNYWLDRCEVVAINEGRWVLLNVQNCTDTELVEETIEN